uniref:Uncharacterized protein n=1 Tax=Ditylenchus dipsaci TaxID=166011 RepID=A0A915E6X7_9BILA
MGRRQREIDALLIGPEIERRYAVMEAARNQYDQPITHLSLPNLPNVKNLVNQHLLEQSRLGKMGRYQWEIDALLNAPEIERQYAVMEAARKHDQMVKIFRLD